MICVALMNDGGPKCVATCHGELCVVTATGSLRSAAATLAIQHKLDVCEREFILLPQNEASL